MAKPWQTGQWKKKRSEFLKDKACEWCGSRENLAIHHIQHFKGLKEYKNIVSKMIREYSESGKNEGEKQYLLAEVNKRIHAEYSYFCPNCGYPVYARKTIVPKYKCKKCGAETEEPKKKQSSDSRLAFRREFSKLFLQRHKDEIDKMFAQAKENSNKDYMDFKNVTVLCKRCHYAKEKGLVLCKVCRKKYHRPKYGKCWECFTKTNGGKTMVQRNRVAAYTHPWCGKIFQIKGGLWEIEANPKTCCIGYCEDDADNCEMAKRNWG